MRRALVYLLALTSALVLAAAAQAAGGRIAVYEVRDVTTAGAGIVWGQILDAKPGCTADRSFRLVLRRHEGSKTEVLDRGRSSREGAISGLYLIREVRDAYDVGLVAPQVSGCPTLRQSFTGLLGDGDLRTQQGWTAPRSRFVKSQISLLNANGFDDHGAIGGAIFLSPRGDCFESRRIKLLGDRKLLDKGVTTQNGAWALHLTWDEHETVERFRIKLAKETRGNDRCGAASLAFGPGSL